jgi:hypothetical protein
MGNDLFEYSLNFNRRRFLSKASLGLGSLALGSLLVPGLFGGGKNQDDDFVPGVPHFAPFRMARLLNWSCSITNRNSGRWWDRNFPLQ